MSESERRASAPDPRTAAVSAVVVNYQGERYLERCLGALVALGNELDEIVLVDDASTDGGLALAQRAFPSVRIVALDRNGGPCVARNRGLAEARHRWVLLVDNDAVIEPDALRKLRAAAFERSSAVAQPRAVFDGEPSRVHYDGARFHYVGLLVLRNFHAPLEQAEGRGTVAVDGMTAVTLLVDRDALRAVGGFDEELYYLMEDYDLSFRLRLAGYTICSAEDAIVRHMGGTAGLSFRADEYPARRAFFHSRNRCRLLLKNHQVRSLVLAVPALVLYEIVWFGFTLKARLLGPYLRGKLRFLRELPRVLRQRREVQRLRVVRDRELLVGGPLTLNPQLLAKPFARRVALALDALLRGWWSLVRRFA
ncbi:MAG: glycosyltransferase family 2 protein [Planctomycetes bacterium]|nr:glycosyltransferase family 2 protein [Planctomycetota bacterium]